MTERADTSMVRKFKATSYKLLRKVHALEKFGRQEKIKLKRLGDHFAVVLFLQHFHILLDKAFSPTARTYLGVDLLLGRFQALIEEVSLNVHVKRPLEKGQLAKVLVSFTATFGAAIENKESLDLDLDEWARALQCAVTIWGNNI